MTRRAPIIRFTRMERAIEQGESVDRLIKCIYGHYSNNLGRTARHFKMSAAEIAFIVDPARRQLPGWDTKET